MAANALESAFMGCKELYREFCNNVYLGQWEMARACSLSLFQIGNCAQEKCFVVATLKYLASNPSVSRFCWPSLSSPSYISFLSCQLLETLGEDLGEPSSLRDVAEFHVLLEKLLPEASEAIWKDLSSLHFAKTVHTDFETYGCDEISSQDLSEETLIVLKDSAFKHPHQTTLLMEKLIYCDKNVTYFSSINKKIFGVFLHCLTCHVEQLRSSCDGIKNNFTSSSDSIQRIYVFLSLIPDIPGELKPSENQALDGALGHIVSLCASKILKRKDVYQFLLGRGSPKLLKWFCRKEDEYFCRSPMTAALRPISGAWNVIRTDCSLNHHEALLWSVTSESHFLMHILNCAVTAVLQGNASDLFHLRKDVMLSKLQPLVLILAWESCSDDASANNVIEAIKASDLEGPCDNVILECCQKLQYNAYATDWLVNYLREQKQEIHHFELFNRTRNIFTQLQAVSPLRLLHKTCGLKSVRPVQVLELLNMKPKGAWQQEHSNCNLTDSEIYHGYLAMTYVLDAIYFSSVLHHLLLKGNLENSPLTSKSGDPYCASDSVGYEYENATDFFPIDHSSFKIDKASVYECVVAHGFQATFEFFVRRMLKKSKEEIRNISVFSLRVEILENLFSLLFLTKNDFCDTTGICSDSDEGYEGEDKHLQRSFFESPSSSANDVIDTNIRSWSRSSSVDKTHLVSQETNVLPSNKTNRLNKNMEVMKRYSGQFILSTTKLKDSEDAKEDASEMYSGHASSRSTGSSGSTTISATGFLCNEPIVKELLLILKDAILELEAEWCKVPKDVQDACKGQVKDRYSRLLQLVHEAQWRYDLVHSENFRAIFQSDFVPESEAQNAFSFDDFKYPMGGHSMSGAVTKSSRMLRRKRKKRRKRSSDSYSISDCSREEPDIIQRMLSTPDALIRYSMWRGNSLQAEQVIKLFKLKNSAEARELCFSNNISKLKARVVEFDKNKSTSHEILAAPPKFESENAISAIAQEVSSGILSTGATSFIDQQLNIIGIPEESESLYENNDSNIMQQDLLSGYKNLHSIILNDLSLSSCVSLELSSVLLDMALKKWKDSQKHSEPVGPKKKQQENRETTKNMCIMMSFLREIQSFFSSKGNNPVMQVFFPFQDPAKISFSSILINYIGVFECSQFNNYLYSWEDFSLVVEEFVGLLGQDCSENKISKITGSRNDLHTTFKKLVKRVRNLSLWTKDVIKPGSDNYIDYLNVLFLHLKQVTEALEGYNFQNQYSAEECSSYFTVLRNSPSELLMKIVTETASIPERVEKLASDMKMDMAHVLTQWYFPHIPLFHVEAPVSKFHSSPHCTIGSLGFPCIILNSISETFQSLRHPCVVAKELLEDFLHMIQAFTSAKESGVLSYRDIISISRHSSLSTWQNKCSELACVDLNLLQTREEKLSFFINVTNVAWLHAVLSEISVVENYKLQEAETAFQFHSCEDDFSEDRMNASFCHLTSCMLYERLLRQKIVGYCVGQLGVISLFDLRYQVLHMNISAPKHLDSPPYNNLLGEPKEQWIKYAPPSEPRLIFVLCECMLSSPKLQVIDPSTVNDQLEDAMKDFLNYTVKVDEQNLKVEFPQLLEWYALDLEGTYESDDNKPEFEGLVNLVSTFLRGNLAQSLQFLLSLDFLHGFSENIDYSGKNQLPFHLHFSPGCPKFGIILEYVSNTYAVECSAEVGPPKSLDSPQSDILHYLKEKCWLLSDLYNFIDKDAKEEAENASLHDDDDKDSINVECDSPVERLLAEYKSLWSKTSGDTDKSYHWFVSSLSPVPRKEFTLHQIEKCFAAGEWEALLEYTHLFLARKSDYTAEFSVLLQLNLIYLSNEDPKSESQFLEPWSCAMCVPDPSAKVDCVLKNVSKWPEANAVQALRYCLVDKAVKERRSLFDAVDKELKKILVYKKILDSCKTKKLDSKHLVPSFSNWQEFAECSVENQSAVFKCLEAYQLYGLAVEWCQLHSVASEHEMDALALQILYLLDKKPSDTEEVYKALHRIGDVLECVALCEKILPKVLSLSNKLCLVQYLTSVAVEYPEKKKFYNILFGLKILLAMNSANEENYLALTEYPLLLLEQLLMNKEVKQASLALQAVSEELKPLDNIDIIFNQQSINKLVEKYAFKAIELRTMDIELESSTSSSTALSSEDSPAQPDQFVMPSSVPTKDEWIADSKVQICQVCQEEQFNMFCRRHHCRRCGRVICSSCSQNTLIVEGYGKVGVRVCDDCFTQTTSTSTEKRHSVFSPTSRRPSGYDSNLLQLPHTSFSPMEKLLGIRWQLSPEEEQNISVRNEFSYEEAPSVSLCLSILKLHLDIGMCAKFMLTLCDHLINKIKPSPSGKTFAEVDYSLVISMVRALLLNAKMKYHDIQNIDDVAEIDTYFKYLDIMQLLVNDNCKHLIPREELTSIETVRKLCDKLVEEERMSLAQEVATKCGLDKSFVWKAWGLFYLRAGCWSAAREKFTKCLQVPKDRSKQKQEDPLLHKIITCLEEARCPAVEKFPAVYSALESLQSIRKGGCPVKHEKTQFDDQKWQECLFYLLTYGTHASVVSFYQRHGFLFEALSYILEKKCHPDIFVEAVFMPSLKCDQLTSLQLLLHSSDPNLFIWWSYLIYTCRYLQRLEFFNVLSNMQVFMKDYVRAAKSSINFYLAPADSYYDLHERLHHLRKAKSLLEEYMRDNPTTNVSENYPVRKTVLTLPAKEIESYLRTIELQEEVSHFFHFCSMQNVDSTFYTPVSSTEFKIMDSKRLPTLFQSGKPQLIIMILINSLKIKTGFDLSLKIIKEYGLNATSVISSAVHLLNYLNRSDNIPSFLLNIKNMFAGIVNMDEITMECIAMTVPPEYQAEYFEELLRFIVSDKNKITAYLKCGRLKSAFLLAVKMNRPDDVFRIMKAAEENKQQAVRNMCEKWLQAHS